ncbi:MAG TPA: hypothetical protein VFR95_00935 [Gemmatimonadaceae bacterium]|nr:hypothetical protein [Gemmatimonadaceae bacterium]
MSVVSCAVLCVAIAACGGKGDKVDAGANGVPDVADASAVPDAKGGAGGGHDADLRELEEYRLSMKDVNRWVQASRNLAQLAEKLEREHPEMAKQREAVEESGARSFDDYENSIDQVPGARDAIEESGLSVHEFAIVGWALIQAGMAQYAVEQGADPKELAAKAHINPDNLTFAREHKAELAKLQGGS